MQPESLYRLTMSALDRIKNQLTIFHTPRVGLDFLFQRHYQRLLYKQGGVPRSQGQSRPLLLFSPEEQSPATARHANKKGAGSHF
jgi:hypothetical protein